MNSCIVRNITAVIAPNLSTGELEELKKNWASKKPPIALNCDVIICNLDLNDVTVAMAPSLPPTELTKFQHMLDDALDGDTLFLNFDVRFV
jgi:hypothetical protein